MLPEATGNQVVVLNRSWKTGDVVELVLPMHIFKNTWYENSVSVERGPITYALKIGEEVKLVYNDKDPIDYGDSYYEIRPSTPWNYGLKHMDNDKLEASFSIQKTNAVTNFPWNAESAPVMLKTKARRIPSWQLYNDMTGPMPYSITYGMETANDDDEITLIPYGCTQLHISQFPVIANR